MQMQEESINIAKKMMNLRMDTVVISGVNLLIGEKRILGLAILSER
jgi:hypothetical protein